MLLIPASLTIGTNVGNNTPLDVQFVASIREHGVLQPITAIRTYDGVEVRDGQRRALAARPGHDPRIRGIRIVTERTLATSDVVGAKPSRGHPASEPARSGVKQLRCAHGDSAYPGSPCSSGGRGAGPVMRGTAAGVGTAVGATVSVRVTPV
jgi:ParB-like nuclease domain